MKVHLIKKQTIEDYVEEHAAGHSAFERWLSIILIADWEEPADILFTFGSADILGSGSNRVVFNIGGNNYRMICKYAFGKKMVHLFVCWMGTHAEYTRLCNTNMQFDINKY
ncbi:MAG: type II toxin-antitoxin system HigB family toxin [Bacteroidia bacterium]